ncbi:Response regulator of zinc sigma-54-dependent two-component system [Labilithrix luteola]|uniref:Response regulator of zinc sigma-54-dependent two-component system n=1 Tax=Labilithrix luteola TaxID=1391654 RepID=A0A0K1QDA4_9BACT|nr:sigma-54 dependent transcriptional regulator [Labilithrix luteola]AKV03746.1 Response regulator of zinc sigma-54-dependent two-component system [Labilithrix luteola]
MELTSGSDFRGEQTARSTRANILFIGESSETARELRSALAQRGYALSNAESGVEGIRKLAREASARVAVLLLPIADSTARGFIDQLRAVDAGIPLIVVGKDGDVANAGDAFELGAAEYIEDALVDPPELLSAIGALLGTRTGDRQLQYLRAKERPDSGWDSVLGESPAIHRVVATLRQVCARTQRGATPTIFLGGETGTGKGFVAKCIHYNGARRNRPFVEVNCAALPATLIEAELFGHERGSFTDAKTSRAGLFETADGGTLFLDEISSLPLDLQAKLLTAIEEKKVRRIGARRATAVDVQIIAATHQPLERLVRDGTFREDLFHRLNVVTVTIPPLRERGRDVLILARAFLTSYCREYGTPTRALTSQAERWMLDYRWPGNVRELRNQIERVVLLQNDDAVRPEHFTTSSSGSPTMNVEGSGDDVRIALPPTGVSLGALEREILRQALSQCDGNVSRAARFLSISRQTLIYRMKKYSLEESGARR